jgi:hypothetical protein
MAYHEQSFKQRFSKMGDEAEGIYKEVEPLGKSQRLGWRRPKVAMSRMTDTLKHLPDFYADSGYLVEVVGLGRDGILKIKLSKYEALKEWAKVQAVVLFVWNSSERQWLVLGWDDVKRLVAKARNAGIEAFNDGNEYYPVQWEWCTEAVSFVGRL